jgi:tRNA nucleotidyltransferase (CCA-adding enzyme)
MAGKRSKGFSGVRAAVLRRVKPSPKEYSEEMDFAGSLIERIKAIKGHHTEVILAGSVARNTHLKGDRDIDIFILFPPAFPEADFEKEGLRIAKSVFRGHYWEKAFSEHPYIRGRIEGYNVEIVPSYKVASAERLKSSVDRTPFHNEYMQGKLTAPQKDEVRLLKQFLKGIGSYGAELKYSSVPGYVTEILIAQYSTFADCLKAASKWKRSEVIDVESHYAPHEPLRKFDSHLVIVDPVDKNRNVAAALSYNQYARFIAASRAFLEKPSTAFFFGKKFRPAGRASLREMLKGKELIAVKLKYPKGALADIIWGQGKRMQKKTANQLALNNFTVNRHECWTDESSMLLLLFELESLTLQRITKKLGPEVINEEHGRKFIEAHRRAVAGPRIENGRWVLETERKYTRADAFMRDYLKKLRLSEKKPVVSALRKGPVILDEASIMKLYSKNTGFRDFLTGYLRGRETFL